MANFTKLMILLISAALVAVAGVSLAGPSAKAAPAPTYKALMPALRKVFATNLQACQTEDIVLVMSTMHAKSPFYAQSEQTMKRLFAAYDLNYELLSLAFVGKDSEYAVVRAKQKTTKLAGPAFRDNILDAMHILRKDGKSWKLWQSAVLQVQYVPQAP